MSAETSATEVEVVRGEIRVSAIDLMLDTDYARVWEVDLDSKYAEVGSICDDGTIMLVGCDRTLRMDEECRGEATVITVPVPGGWTVMAECARYTCRIVAWKPVGRAPCEIAWRETKEGQP